ncbi:MAG: tRNA preQ1(34) S-adenosylmethionine ribosyltransferase-isomerase QueA [Acidobacteriota bacterium]
MKASEFDFELPSELIAQHPASSREQSRLLVVDRESGQLQHFRFSDLPDLLSIDDLVVLNDTRVFPARLLARRGGRPIEVLLVRPLGGQVWEALVRPGRQAKPGTRLIFQPSAFEARVLEGPLSATRRLRFEYRGDFWKWIDRLGRVPLPPYIRRTNQTDLVHDRERYQTVFAKARGAIAAPTAGLHFTGEILDRIPHCFLTLHIGYGTFRPLSSDVVEEHRMAPETYVLPAQTARRVSGQRQGQGRVVAVGSTTTRVLEFVPLQRGRLCASRGWTDLFIYPGFQFRVVTALLTNFHLPRSTLFLLVSAFGGKELIRECYRQAIEQRYRFYSYGDAMLIL